VLNLLYSQFASHRDVSTTDSNPILPPSSVVLFLPSQGLPKLFNLDAKTNQWAISTLDPALYPDVVLFYIFVPLLLAALLCALALYLVVGALRKHRADLL
jgi:hypothetical protein